MYCEGVVLRHSPVVERGVEGVACEVGGESEVAPSLGGIERRRTGQRATRHRRALAHLGSGEGEGEG